MAGKFIIIFITALFFLQELESTRNCLAHHRIKDLSEILTIWDRIMRLKIIIKSDPNPNLGIDIFNTCNIIQQLYPSDDD